MALLHIDGFDHYGLDENNMTDGMYLEVDSQSTSYFTLSTANPRTGTYNLRRGTGFNGTHVVRTALGGEKTTAGQGVAVYFSQLPAFNNTYVLYDFRDAANAPQISVVIQSTGAISIVRGNNFAGDYIYTTPTPVVVAEAYQHIETWVTIDDAAGAVELRVNGVTVVSLTGVNTAATLNIETSQVALLGGSQKTGLNVDFGVTTDFDDYFIADDTGAYNNDFIGDRRVLTLFPNADTATEQWIPSTGSDSYAMINEADPDDETSYILCGPNDVGDQSQFELEDLPAEVSAVSGIMVVDRSRKTDAGPGNINTTVVSGASTAVTADHVMTEAYTYRKNVIEQDPGTSLPFTPTEVNNLKLKIERTG